VIGVVSLPVPQLWVNVCPAIVGVFKRRHTGTPGILRGAAGTCDKSKIAIGVTLKIESVFVGL